MSEKTIGVSNVTPKYLFDYDRRSNENFVVRVSRILLELYKEGYYKVITGGGQGLDQVVFWAVERLKEKGCDLKNVLYLPYRNQADIWQPRGFFSKESYAKMLKAADEVVYVNDKVVEFSEMAFYQAERDEAISRSANLIITVEIDPEYKKLSDLLREFKCSEDVLYIDKNHIKFKLKHKKVLEKFIGEKSNIMSYLEE